MSNNATQGAGALILSEFTGAIEELPEALPCNPFDLDDDQTRDRSGDISPWFDGPGDTSVYPGRVNRGES